MTDTKPTIITPQEGEIIIPGSSPLSLEEQLEQIFRFPDENISNEVFFNQLMMRLKPVPPIAPTFEPTHHLSVDNAVDHNLVYETNPRQRLISNLSLSMGLTVRFMRILDSFGRIYLVFSLPHGYPSHFEREADRENPQAVAFKQAFTLLHNQLTTMSEVLNTRLDLIEGEQKKIQKAMVEEAKKAEAERKRLRDAQVQLEQARRLQAQRVSQNSQWRWDPVTPLIGIKPEFFSRYYKEYYSALYLHLVGWGEYQTMQEQQAWKQKAEFLGRKVIHEICNGSMASRITRPEQNQFADWLNLAISKPDMWMMYIPPNEPDTLKMRGGF